MDKLPLLLLPGLLCDAEVWSHQRDHLSPFADVIIPDLNQAASPHDMVTAALKNAPTYFAMAGHSMGGWVALEIMKDSPERVKGLALLNTTAHPDSKEKHASRQAMIAQAIKGDYSSIIDKLMTLFVYNTAVTHRVKLMLERNIHAFINQETAMIQREDCMNVLDTITCPTLIIHSNHDAIFNLDDSRTMALKIKHATFSILENCGHMSPMESPEDVTQQMEQWLERIRKN